MLSFLTRPKLAIMQRLVSFAHKVELLSASCERAVICASKILIFRSHAPLPKRNHKFLVRPLLERFRERISPEPFHAKLKATRTSPHV